MCNLSQGIREKGVAEGEIIGEARGVAIGEARIILSMYKNGYTLEQIAEAADKNIEEVKAIIEKKEAVLI